MKYYAVRKGHNPGIYTNWESAKIQVNGYSGAEYKSFASLPEAEEYIGIISKAEPQKDYDLTIYTDGSCKDNIGGYGILIIEKNGTYKSCYGGISGYCTNNIAELMAIYQTLCLLFPLLETNKISSVIYTDSEYCVKIFNEYIINWLKNGWKTAKSTEVENMQLIKNIYSLLQRMNVKICWIKGHNNHIHNDHVDSLAERGRLTIANKNDK